MSPQLRNDPDRRMTDVVTSAGVGDGILEWFDLSRLDREQFRWWIASLAEAERGTRALRLALEDALVDAVRRCPVCDVPVTGRADKTYCSARCRQRARRAEHR